MDGEMSEETTYVKKGKTHGGTFCECTEKKKSGRENKGKGAFSEYSTLHSGKMLGEQAADHDRK